METKHKIIIIVLIIIIAALLVGIVAVMPNLNKHDTDLTFKSKSTITEGGSIKIKLTDDNGTALANQTVNITITDKDKTSDYHSVVTDEKGVAKLKLDKDPGKYEITAVYGGDDHYNPCNATKKITVKEKVVEAVVTSSSTTTNTHTVMGEDGYYYVVDDNGNILESLGPSKTYHPDDPNSVDYPNAEPAWNYIDKSK